MGIVSENAEMACLNEIEQISGHPFGYRAISLKLSSLNNVSTSVVRGVAEKLSMMFSHKKFSLFLFADHDMILVYEGFKTGVIDPVYDIISDITSEDPLKIFSVYDLDKHLNIVKTICREKIEAAKLEAKSSYSLSRLIDDICMNYEELLLAKDLEPISVVYEGNVIGVMVEDATRLLRILKTFVYNAIKFTQKGGIKIQVKLDEDIMRISVLDTGIGISKEKQEHLFEKGTGLGTCREYAALMGGTIGVNSLVGYGSEFWFEMPFKTIQPTHEKPESPVNIEHLNIFTDGNKKGEKELTSFFFEAAKHGLKELNSAIEKNDVTAWRNAAHRLKGCSANYGAHSLSEICLEAETGFEQNIYMKRKNYQAATDELKKIARFMNYKVELTN